MTAQPFVLTPHNYPRPLNVAGERVTVLASGEATKGYEVFSGRAARQRASAA
jgi:hypothetical protein